MADLVVTIGADSKAYKSIMEEAARQAAKTATNIEQAAGKINKSVTEMGAKVSGGSKTAAFALTNLGRVAQDAPFGFIAIQNNIGPLIDGLGYLSKEAKATGVSIGSLVKGALLGPAGLGVAVSLITAGITLFVQHQQSASRALKETKKSTDDYVDSLDSLSQAQLKGAQSGAQETTRLDILYKATQNHALSIRDRNLAYDELESRYPKFFSDSEREHTLLGENTSAYMKLRDAILAAALAKAAEDKIGENSSKTLEINKKITDELIAQANARKQTSNYTTQQTQQLFAPQENDLGANLNQNTLFDKPGEKELRESIERENELRRERFKINKENFDLVKFATEQETKAGFKLNSTFDDGNKKLAAQKDGFAVLEEQIGKIKVALEDAVISNQPSAIHQLSTDLTEAQEKLELLKKTYENSLLAGKGAPDLAANDTLSGLSASSSFQVSVSPEEMDKAVKAFQEYANLKAKAGADQKEYNKDLKKETELGREMVNVFGKGLTNAFESAVSGTQSLIGALGQFLGQLITQLIAAALAAAALAIILSAVGFGAGLGGAAESFGSFKNLFNGLSGIHAFADGGIVTGPTRALIGETGQPEAIIPLSRMKEFTGGGNGMQDGQIVGVLSGPDMLLKWINRAQKTQSRLS